MRSLPAAMLCAITGSLLLAGCASPVHVAVDPAADFSRYRTWDWLPGEALVIHVPEAENGLAELRLARGISEQLARRGFRRARERPDLRVGVVLAVRSGLRVTQQTGAVESVFTYHEGATFEVQSSHTVVQRFDHLRLEVYVSEDRGPVIWRGRLDEEVEGSGVVGLDDSLPRLLAEFPTVETPRPVRASRDVGEGVGL